MLKGGKETVQCANFIVSRNENSAFCEIPTWRQAFSRTCELGGVQASENKLIGCFSISGFSLKDLQVIQSWVEWDGWPVGKRNLDSVVFREAFVCTRKDVPKNTVSST